MTRLFLVVIANAATVGASSAHSEETGRPGDVLPDEPPLVAEVSIDLDAAGETVPVIARYWLPVAIVDAVLSGAVVVVAVGGVRCNHAHNSDYCTGTRRVVLAGAALTLVSGPVVHLVKGNPKSAALSLVVRIAAPFAAYYAVKEFDRELAGLALLAAAGGARALDYLFLSKHEVAMPSRFVPTISLERSAGRSSASAGILGHF